MISSWGCWHELQVQPGGWGGCIIRKLPLSCRIFDSFGKVTRTLCHNHSSPILTTWSNRSIPLSLPPSLTIFQDTVNPDLTSTSTQIHPPQQGAVWAPKYPDLPSTARCHFGTKMYFPKLDPVTRIRCTIDVYTNVFCTLQISRV